jgi:hypothetical protein
MESKISLSKHYAELAITNAIPYGIFGYTLGSLWLPTICFLIALLGVIYLAFCSSKKES